MFYRAGKGSEGVQSCFLQEVAVRDHLLQGPGHVWDDTLFAVHQLRQDVMVQYIVYLWFSEVEVADSIQVVWTDHLETSKLMFCLCGP